MKSKGVFDSVFLASVLCGAGGFLDAYSYTARGGVLATAQTGNMIFLCAGLAQGDFARALACFLPIAAFSLGVLTSLLCKKTFYHNEALLAALVLFAQLAVLCAVPFIGTDGVANALISYACGAQIAVFRAVKGHAYATTMCTGNLRSALENGFKYANTKNEKYKNAVFIYIIVIISFLLGAFAGAVLTPFAGVHGAFAAAGAILLCALVCLSKSRSTIQI